MLTFFQRFRFSSSLRGFTLTELLVVITIMTILTTIFLLQQRQFDSTTLLRSLAYSVALSIREAQTYGTSVRSFTVGSVTEFPAYGVYFNISTPTQYIVFADVNDDGQYAGDSTEFVDDYSFQGNYSISDLCANWSGSSQCSSNGGLITELTITFRRPNPDACIATDLHDTVCGATNVSQYSEAAIQISGPGGTSRSVTVTPSGQISVGAAGS